MFDRLAVRKHRSTAWSSQWNDRAARGGEVRGAPCAFRMAWVGESIGQATVAADNRPIVVHARRLAMPARTPDAPPRIAPRRVIAHAAP